ncbi:MAG TPA: hypothetical protein VMG30_02805 [Acidobacteriota bacterium]|nr:hypothetical protein [Acidobacteriota bacterium]
MNKRRLLSIGICLILFGQCLAWAQSSARTDPLKVLWLYREDVKVAKGRIHQRVEHEFAQLWAKGQIQPSVAAEAMSGNPTEILFISGYDSFAEFEKDYQAYGKVINGPQKILYNSLSAQEAELVNTARSLLAVYSRELSYHPERIMPDMPKSRYMEATVMRTRPGKEAGFAALIKLYQSAMEKANVTTPWVVYEGAEGAQSGTHLILIFYKSLKEIDDAMALEPKIMAAMGEEAFKNMSKEMADFIVSAESNLYMFNPEMSLAPKEFISADPEFWSPKPKPAPAPASGTKQPAK